MVGLIRFWSAKPPAFITVQRQQTIVNVDIKFSAHDTHLKKHSGTLTIERFESQIILIFGALKPKGLNEIAKIGYGNLREENLNIMNNYII